MSAPYRTDGAPPQCECDACRALLGGDAREGLCPFCWKECAVRLQPEPDRVYCMHDHDLRARIHALRDELGAARYDQAAALVRGAARYDQADALVRGVRSIFEALANWRLFGGRPTSLYAPRNAAQSWQWRRARPTMPPRRPR